MIGQGEIVTDEGIISELLITWTHSMIKRYIHGYRNFCMINDKPEREKLDG